MRSAVCFIICLAWLTAGPLFAADPAPKAGMTPEEAMKTHTYQSVRSRPAPEPAPAAKTKKAPAKKAPAAPAPARPAGYNFDDPSLPSSSRAKPARQKAREPEEAKAPARRPGRQKAEKAQKSETPARSGQGSAKSTRLTTGQDRKQAKESRGFTPTPGWEPEPGEKGSSRSTAVPGFKTGSPAKAEAAPEPRRRVREEPAPTRITLKSKDETAQVGYNFAPEDKVQAQRQARKRSEETASLTTPVPLNRQVRESSRPTRLKLKEDEPLAMVTADEALKRELEAAYRDFDAKYTASLGKTRSELKSLWGFPMQSLGKQENEEAVGFRQRGTLGLIEPPSGRKKAAESSADGKSFACLVVLWVDRDGKGVVVDGDAVGDCFYVDALKAVPVQYER